MANDSVRNLRSSNKVNCSDAINKKNKAVPKSTTTTRTTPVVNSAREPSNQLRTSTGLPASRLSSVLPNRNDLLEERIAALEARLTSAESLLNQLQTENINLQQTVAQLNSKLSSHEEQAIGINRFHSETESGISIEQQEVNTNIVIRGIDLNENASEADLRKVFDGLRSHLEIADVTHLSPVNIKIVTSNPGKTNQSFRPIQVQFPTVEAKTQFLQVRRIKKDIFPSDIGVHQQILRPLLISEQLTRQNQELFHIARSLRGRNGYKFVWTNNGQILARQTQNSKVIRIKDSAQVLQLKTQTHLNHDGGC